MPTGPTVIVVTYNSDDVISDCLQSLLAQTLPPRRIIVVDNDSQDTTVAEVQRHVQPHEHRRAPLAAPVTLIRATSNRGFAAGVNLGLDTALQDHDARLFWILNPDCIADPEAARAYSDQAHHQGDFALMGGRTLFMAEGDPVQSDGGVLSGWTAVCSNVNRGQPARLARRPDPSRLDFVSGANLVASRVFVERAGPMPEDYFLYYEEVDWAMRRGSLPLVTCPEAVVRHHGGTSAGSGTITRPPTAFSNYFNYRNRLRFARKHRPFALAGAYLHSMAKIAQLAMGGARAEAVGAFCGLHQLRPPQRVREQVAETAAPAAFGGVSG